MKYNVIIWADGVDEESPFSAQAIVYADDHIEAIKKVLRDVEKLEGEGI